MCRFGDFYVALRWNLCVDIISNRDLNQLLCSKVATGVFYKKAVLKNFAIFTGKHLCWSLFLIKVKAFSTPISKSICEGLLLVILPLHYHIEVATILLYSIGDFWGPLAALGSWKTLNYRQKQPSRGVLGKSVWKYAANLQENTHTRVLFQ